MATFPRLAAGSARRRSTVSRASAHRFASLTAAFSEKESAVVWLGEYGTLRQGVVGTIGPADLIAIAANDD